MSNEESEFSNDSVKGGRAPVPFLNDSTYFYFLDLAKRHKEDEHIEQLLELSRNYEEEAAHLQGVIEKEHHLDIAQELEREAAYKKAARTSVLKLALHTVIQNSPFIIMIMVIVFMFSSTAGGKPRNIFGYVPLTVLTRSMQSVYPQNSFVLARTVDSNTLNVGDDITFIKKNDTTVTHRIVGINENYQGTGKRAFETKGVDNQAKDEEKVTYNNVIGKIIFHSYLLGLIIVFIKENIVVSVVFLFTLIFFLETLSYTYKRRKERKKQEGLRAPRTHLEEGESYEVKKKG
jgi:signal peptidase I